MTRNCRCGGKLVRTDIVGAGEVRLESGRIIQQYKDSDRFVAHWSCSCCGKEYQQRKRQPAILE